MKLIKNDLTTSINLFLNKIPDINKLLKFCTDNKCSDLYIKVGEQPYISRYGRIYKVPSIELTNKVWGEWAENAITSELNAKYVRQKMLDFSYELPLFDEDNNIKNIYRYRVSAGFSENHNIATFRMISKEAPSFELINFPKDIEEILRQIAFKRNKITMINGVTGSGKTTTFASCINDFSKPGQPFENSVIISLEDPIEYKFKSTDHVKIVQKELGVDFKEYSLGVKQALREHPNYVNVGETRDSETINTIIEASRTGHAVWTTFHTTDVADTISRLYRNCNNCSKDIMYDLIMNMNLILCQRIKAAGDHFVLNTQYMIFTHEIVMYLTDMIEQNKNIPKEIDKLFSNPILLKNKIVKNWD